MPPKQVSTEATVSPLTAADATFIMTVLKKVDTMTVNWKDVAATAGIARADNATAKLNTILKKINHKYLGGKIVSLDDAAAAAAVPKTPKKPKATANAAKTPGSTAGKKRVKAAAASGNEIKGEEDGSPEKKAKVEQAGAEDGEVDEGDN